ncbi:uncharacterized protein TRAVEDRAFT_26380 [Trametes versicolor FP-101664 SS1]|uniref:uncharacterized protein n=1 Tax=Trametes versicolor (strain FP-101664) TaxID=717944 RepID=UPI0004624982|nr:uncharacterized protein TRAVEDRAFT_26380 [Trametes versicolor FP-101664 SS1]EIW62825.1 hypothetical protein TRAVEDRAFT_26380 [Trametes versicolor FP-101664 SS1]
MSYASVAAHNAPPPSQQPHADQGLLTTEPPSANNIADDGAKVNIVSSDFKKHPATTTSVQDIPADLPTPGAPKGGRKSKGRRYLDEAEQEGFYLWNVAKYYILQPSVAGGLVGLVNLGLIGGTAYTYYTKPHLRRDTRAIASTVAAALALFTGEGYAAEKYSETPRGQREAEKAKKEGAALYRVAREHILRPGVLGGLVGVVNAGILGAVGYFSYTNWDRPSWDRRTVSAVTVGLLTLWTGEGYVAERYRTTHH